MSTEELGLCAEHGALVDKMFSVGLTPVEQSRLASIRGQLDAIDAKRSGPALDRLERIATALERIAARLTSEPLEMADSPESVLPPCPECGESRDLADSSVMGCGGRVTCKACGKSYTVETVGV